MQVHSPSHALMRQWKHIQASSTSTEKKQHPENTKLIRQYKQMNDFLESCLKQVVLPEHAEREGVRKDLHV